MAHPDSSFTPAEGERRRSPRYLVGPEGMPLLAGVAVVSPAGRPKTLSGRVRDISAGGLSILLRGDEACGELAERGRELAVILGLPSGPIRMLATVAHCGAPGEYEGGGCRLLGVSIAEIGEEDRGRLAEYIGGGAGAGLEAEARPWYKPRPHGAFSESHAPARRRVRTLTRPHRPTSL
jgi:hypothetical protein